MHSNKDITTNIAIYTYYFILDDFFKSQIIYLLRGNNPSKIR